MSYSLSEKEVELVNFALARHVRALREEYKVAIREHHPEGWKFSRDLHKAEILWRKIDDELYSRACMAHGKIDPEYSG